MKAEIVRARGARIAWAAPLVAAVCVLALARLGLTREWDSDEHNVILVVPDEPGAWSWVPETSAWKSRGIVKGASRYLAKLKTGEAATYEGALLHLFELPAPEGKSLDDLAGDPEIRGRLLSRFDGSPAVEVTETTLPPKDCPARILLVDGKARNKLGKLAPAHGRMIVAVARGKLYLLRMYAWPTEYDDEGLKVDLDYIEGEFMIKNTKEKPTKPGPGPKPGVGPGVQTPDGGGTPEGEAEEIDLREHLLKLTKHAKLQRKEVTDDTMLLYLEDADRGGWYQVILYATKNGRQINGQTAPNEDIKKWITTDWWKNFTANHPDGPLHTFRWPRRVKAPTFITLPDLSDDARKVAAKEKRRPIDPKASKIIKMKIVEKVKDKKLGKRFKVSEPFRGILQGNRPRRGKETVLRFAWRSPFFSFRLLVTVGGAGYAKWGDAIRETLESMHHYKR